MDVDEIVEELSALFRFSDVALLKVMLGQSAGVCTAQMLDLMIPISGGAKVFVHNVGSQRSAVTVEGHLGVALLALPCDVWAPSGAPLGCLRCFAVSAFGSHRVGPHHFVLASSPVYRYAVALDRLFDVLFWHWSPASLDDQFEAALLQLLVSLDEDLSSVLISMGTLVQSFTGSAGAENPMEKMLDSIRTDISRMLSGKDLKGAAGRIHSALHQVAMMAKMVTLPASGVNAFRRFESLKCANTAGLEEAIQACSEAIDEYGKHVMVVGGRQAADPHVQQLIRVKTALFTLLSQNRDSRDHSPLWTLRTPGSQFMQSLQQRNLIDRNTVDFWPVIPVSLLSPSPEACAKLYDCLQVYSETLTGSALLLGSIFPQFKLGDNAEANSDILRGVLYGGCGYAGSSDGATIAIMGHMHASMEIGNQYPIYHARLHKRVKDIARVLRKYKRENRGTFSLKINSDFERALIGLQQHHEATTGSWVTPEISNTWRYMVSKGHMTIFELWLDDQMIAADFCHAIPGRAVYVATRYFEHSARGASPGILLALVEMAIMKRVYGVALWDLGSTDSNPSMAYKTLISNVMERPHQRAIYNRLLREDASVVQFPREPHVAIPDITAEHMLKVLKPSKQ